MGKLLRAIQRLALWQKLLLGALLLLNLLTCLAVCLILASYSVQ
jgi:hypothetical protein